MDKAQIEWAKLWAKSAQLISSQGSLSIYHFPSDVAIIIKYFNHFTFPRLSHIGLDSEIRHLCSSYFMIRKREIIGLAVVGMQENEPCQILCFRIKQEDRHQGLGALLLTTLESDLRGKGVNTLQLRNRTYWNSRKIWDRLLSSASWERHSTSLYFGIISRPELQMLADWCRHADMTQELRFETVDKSDLHTLEQLLTDLDWYNSVPTVLNPVQLWGRLDGKSSFLIYSGRRLVGWMMSHNLKKNVCQITSVYIHPTYRGSGPYVFAEFLKRHNNQGPIHFIIRPTNTGMLHFAQRYFEPAGAEIHEEIIMIKRLAT